MLGRRQRVKSPTREYKNRTIITIDWETTGGGYSMRTDQVGHMDDRIKASLANQLLRSLDGKLRVEYIER